MRACGVFVLDDTHAQDSFELSSAETMIELSVKSPSLHPVFGPAFTLYPLFQRYPQSKENFLNLSMKC
jgi:hypothetical protein